MGHNPGQRRSGDSTSALYITKYRPENRAALILVDSTSQIFVATPEERFVRVDTDQPVLIEFSKIDLALNSIIDSALYTGANDLVVGETVQGGTSLATAVVESFVPPVAGVGNPGAVVSVSNVVGTFLDGEVITGGTSFNTVTQGQFALGGTTLPVIPGPGSLRVDEYGFEWLQLGPHAMIRILAENLDALLSLVWGSNDPEDNP